jgi:hypothetical protein
VGSNPTPSARDSSVQTGHDAQLPQNVAKRNDLFMANQRLTFEASSGTSRKTTEMARFVSSPVAFWAWGGNLVGSGAGKLS